MTAKQQNKSLKLTKFGNQILRDKARRLSPVEIKSVSMQPFISSLINLNETKKLGVGIAAPQVGQSIAIALIDISPSKFHPNVEERRLVIINPFYRGIGRRVGTWEGCLSSASKRNIWFAKALRYKQVHAEWIDEDGKRRSEKLEGLVAQVFQHETDHLNGILFVDRVRDTKTYMHASEYKKMMKRTKIGV